LDQNIDNLYWSCKDRNSCSAHTGKTKRDSFESCFVLETELLQFRACVRGGSMFLFHFLEIKTAESGEKAWEAFARPCLVFWSIRTKY